MTARRWTPQDIDTIRVRAEVNKDPPAQIAADYHITSAYLRVLAWRNDIKLPRSPARVVRKPREPDDLARLLSQYATWFAFAQPGATILLIGAMERLAANDFEFVRSFIQGNPLLAPSLVEFSQTFIRLTNNAKLYCLPAGDRGDTIRGFHADLILL